MQLGSALDELATLVTVLVGACMRLQHVQISAEFEQALVATLGAALDHMAASVALINGKLPLNASEEALDKVARCA